MTAYDARFTAVNCSMNGEFRSRWLVLQRWRIRNSFITRFKKTFDPMSLATVVFCLNLDCPISEVLQEKHVEIPWKFLVIVASNKAAITWWWLICDECNSHARSRNVMVIHDHSWSLMVIHDTKYSHTNTSRGEECSLGFEPTSSHGGAVRHANHEASRTFKSPAMSSQCGRTEISSKSSRNDENSRIAI